MGVFSSKGLSWYSNHTVAAMKPDILANGVYVKMVVPTGSCVLCDSRGYATYSGTSFAAPYVTGAVALIKQKHPTWSRDEVIGALLSNVVDKGFNPGLVSNSCTHY